MPEKNSLGPYVVGYQCVICGTVYAPTFSGYVCPKHGNEGILDVLYEYEAAARAFLPGKSATGAQTTGTFPGSAQDRQGMWRYRAMLPLPLEAPVPPLLVGGTPLYDAPRLAARAGVKRLFVKDDSRSPTASFKDRASALAVALAKLRGATVVATASTGNAAAALAGMSAAMQQPCVIFVPATAPPAKLAQLLAYGATVFTVLGGYDQAFELCMEACARKGWYNRNTGYNPFMAEGKKTAAYELAEQLNWNVPDALFVSVGDGCIIAGMHKGFRDLKALKRIDRVPRLYGIQAAGSDFMTQAFERHEAVLTKAPIAAHTVADSISAGLPRDRVKALAAVRDTGGAYLRVEDEAILAAIPELAQGCGVFAEPAAAAAWAGVAVAVERGLVGKDETVCVLCTGSGLKDVSAAVHACNALGRTTIPIEPTTAALEKALESMLL